MSTSAASTSNEDDLRNQVLRDLDGDAETAPADAALFEALTDGERRAVMLILAVGIVAPFAIGCGSNEGIDGSADTVWRCFDLARKQLS